MKNSLYHLALLTLLSIYTTNLSAQYTSIPDANFEQKLIDLSIDTEGTLDGQMLTADAMWIWGLNVSNSSISDLTGIEIFPNIASLDVQGNTLTTLDITSNTALKWLNCYDNSLTSLNTTGLALLETINCRGNAIAGSIDVSSSPNLTHLYCYNNQIGSLDLSNNPNLVLLHAWTNQLGTGGNNNALNMKNGNNANIPTANFNIQFNWHTLCVDVDDVSYSNTNWTNYQSAHTTYSLDCSAPAPVNLSHFSSKKHQSTVELKWETTSEINNAGFEIETSDNGKSWKMLGFVNGNNNSNSLKTYSYKVSHPRSGQNYYRLKQVDYDGKHEYSKILSVMIFKKSNGGLFPNPTNGKINIDGFEDKKLQVLIHDIAGKLIEQKPIEANIIDISNYKKGVYFIQLTSEESTKIFRIIKNNH